MAEGGPVGRREIGGALGKVSQCLGRLSHHGAWARVPRLGPFEAGQRQGRGLRSIGHRSRFRLRSVPHGVAHQRIKPLVLGRGNVGVPINATATPAPGWTADQEKIEDMSGGSIEEDVGHVLAADQVDVIDAQIHRGDLIAAAPDDALPFHRLGQSSPEPVPRREEGVPVQPSRVELGVIGATGPHRVEAVPMLRGETAHRHWSGRQDLVEIRRSQHAHPRAELGHHGAQVGHASILPRLSPGVGRP